MRAARLLAASNGHGEDDITCKVLDILRDIHPGPLDIEAWAMVGTGRAYASRAIPLVGPLNLLPSEGFGTLSPKGLWGDLRHGFLGLLLRQARFARSLAGQHDLILGTGDIIPLMAARISGTPLVFISSAKSAYYDGRDGHTGTERRIMRRACVDTFARDELTAQRLAGRGVPNRYLGNPMMDGLEPVDPDSLRRGGLTVAMLAGSRQDAADNAGLLLAAGAVLAQARGGAVTLLFGAHDSLDLGQVAALADGWSPAQWEHPLDDRGQALCLAHPSGARALLAKRRFGDVLHAADLVCGMAGTANEQAIGLGLPLVAVPGIGNQGPAYVRMKMRFYGDAAVAAERDAGSVAAALGALADDPARRARMAAAGRERMGAPGASRAMAQAVSAHLLARQGGAA